MTLRDFNAGGEKVRAEKQMARKSISDDIQAEVLVRSRRRCCICYGLHRDASLKQGQIAHLDQNSANPAIDNLTFLCFDHHDQYDSTTRQSKNFTEKEVKKYRAELYNVLDARALDPITFKAFILHILWWRRGRR